MDGSKKDGRKVAWWIKKIAQLEEELAKARNGGTGTSSSTETRMVEADFNIGYAEGFFACMSKYGIQTKLQRTRLKDRMLKEGPEAVKRIRGGKMNMPTFTF